MEKLRENNGRIEELKLKSKKITSKKWLGTIKS